MPSKSLQQWQSATTKALDEIDAAHTIVGGSTASRRIATQQINQAYVMLLSGYFQSFCRDLHSEAIDFICRQGSIHDPRLVILRFQLTNGRKLNFGNANEGNLGNDFGRFDFNFWNVLDARYTTNAQLRVALRMLNNWRNAIAHQDFDPAVLGTRLHVRLADVRRWRSACNRLALQFDSVVAGACATITGRRPW